jgi:chemotaxis protein methyltransferase CheR
MKIRDVDLSHFKIIATDISETVLEAAQTGRYDGLSVERGLERDYLACFFERRGNHWFIHDSIKGAVEFRRFNLADEYATPGQFDIVFCRYVMIYFSEEAKRTLIKKISSSLNPGGVMFLGNSEILNIETGKFEQLNYNTGIFFRIRR